jgi:heme/copper-type cytochrome/quinol oxidase subunit 3
VRLLNRSVNGWAGRLSRHRRGPLAGLMVLVLGLLMTGTLYAAFSPAQAEQTETDAAQVAKGRELFLVGCAFCHGQNGEGVTIPSSAYGTMFYLTTGFHGLHVTGGLIAFLFVLGRTYLARRFTHEQAVTAIVVSYYWHFVDVVWIGLFFTIYVIQ